MKKTICDRCKKEISNIAYLDPRQQTTFPIINIFKIYNAMDSRQVDLCDNCKVEFLSWLNEMNVLDPEVDKR